MLQPTPRPLNYICLPKRLDRLRDNTAKYKSDFITIKNAVVIVIANTIAIAKMIVMPVLILILIRFRLRSLQQWYACVSCEMPDAILFFYSSILSYLHPSGPLLMKYNTK